MHQRDAPWPLADVDAAAPPPPSPVRPSRTSPAPARSRHPTFARLAHSTSTFQLALDALLPVLDAPTPAELTDRILVAFILFALYAPHPIAINPFKSVLFVTFVKECEKALALAGGGVAPNEPLVWIDPYSPSALARTLPVPPNFRATKLIIDESLCHAPASSDLDDVTYPYDTAPTPDADTRVAERTITPQEDARGEAIAPAVRLLLARRARVGSLAKQRANKNEWHSN
ncbi:hypothetical protein FB451DRAFT_1195366 [Mycena latifolia]|nr:hypothetical protein FB451DRAFT_1195366 [Mycena latifolia]